MFKRIDLLTDKIDQKPTYQYALLAVITLLAAALRLYNLGEWSFWFDEVSTLNRTLVHYADFETIIRTSIAHKFLPLSIILTSGALNLFGVSEWSARLVPALFGIISVPVFYFPTKKIFGWQVGLLAVFLLAISPWHIYWSQNARFYTSLLFFFTLALFAFYFAIEHDRPLFILIAYLLTYLALSERLGGFWIGPVIVCYLILLKVAPFEKPPGFRPRNILLILILPVISMGIIEIISLATTGSPRFLTASFFTDLDFFFTSPLSDPVRLLYHITFKISFPVIFVGFFGGIYLLARKNRAGLFFLVSALLPIILLALLQPFVHTRDRYVFVTLFSWLILTAVAVRELFAHLKDDTRILAVSIPLLLVATAVGASMLYYGLNNGDRRDWKAAFDLVQERAAEGDVVVSFWPKLTGYYLGEEGMDWETISPEIITNSNHRYWFVLDSLTIWQNLPMKSWLTENAQLIDVYYLRVTEDLALRIYLYDPHKGNPP